MSSDRNFCMKGRRVLITGAASGIGEGVAQLFRQHGAKLALLDKSAAALTKVAASCDAVPLVADLRQADEVGGAVDLAAKRLGGLDCVVNAAGVLSIASLDDLKLDEWNMHIAVNLTAPFLVCQAAAGHLREAPFGSIVNVASGIALRSVPSYSAYAASKAGLVSFTKSIAQELAPKVRVNAVCPGPIETPMIKDLYSNRGYRERAEKLYLLQRFGKIEEVVSAILFLCSQESSFITGTAMAIDGGRSLH
jgi:NAD(P)-dependent dehydrogenase (short-subunit alcohol dehydrogenase family)